MIEMFGIGFLIGVFLIPFGWNLLSWQWWVCMLSLNGIIAIVIHMIPSCNTICS